MVPPLHTKKILIKKCFIDQKGLRAASIYSHCTTDPRNPYHNLLAPVTRNCTIFNYANLSPPTPPNHSKHGGELHPVSLDFASV